MTDERLEALARKVLEEYGHLPIHAVDGRVSKLSKLLRKVVDTERAEEHDRIVNKPEVVEFLRGVAFEQEHQRERWGREHDDSKEPETWFWVLGYLAGKALAAVKAGDFDKARHHTISSAALLYHWHHRLTLYVPKPTAPFIPEPEVARHEQVWKWDGGNGGYAHRRRRIGCFVWHREIGGWQWSCGFGSATRSGSEETRDEAMDHALDVADQMALELEASERRSL